MTNDDLYKLMNGTGEAIENRIKNTEKVFSRLIKALAVAVLILFIFILYQQNKIIQLEITLHSHLDYSSKEIDVINQRLLHYDDIKNKPVVYEIHNTHKHYKVYKIYKSHKVNKINKVQDNTKPCVQ